MRIKAVEGIKAYNRDGADLSVRRAARVCLRAYPSLCPPGYPYMRSSTAAVGFIRL